MKFALMFYSTPAAPPQDPAQQQAQMQPWVDYIAALYDSGITGASLRLMPAATAKSIRVDGGEMRVHDGPYADTREQLGGIIEIEVADIEEAEAWAARSPAAHAGCVEVRQINPESIVRNGRMAAPEK